MNCWGYGKTREGASWEVLIKVDASCWLRQLDYERFEYGISGFALWRAINAQR